jgi:hypothetical protein
MKTTLLILATLISTSVWAQSAPQGAQITGVTMQGTGCKSATASVILSPDGKELSVLFDNFILNANGSNVNPKNLRSELSCTVNVNMYIPYGYQMAFTGVDYRGYAMAPAKTQAYQRLLFQVPGMPITSMRDALFQGPYDNNYTFTALQKPGREVWTACGQTQMKLPLTAVLGVYYQQRGYYPDAMVALDSQDMSLSQDLHVMWRRCL